MSDFAPLIERAFAAAPPEGSYAVRRVRGEVPPFVRGTYYVNGPALFERAGRRYRHWLDGDGMVCALRFGDDGVSFTNRFVRGAKFREEEEAGRFLFRAFGTAFDGDRLKRRVALESPVNVSVYAFGGRLLAFGEQGLPWELDPLTLETRGEFTFGGSLNDVSPFSAHPKFDRETGEMFNFGVSFSNAEPTLNLYRFDARASLIYRRRLPLDFSCSLHDFSLSRSYAVFYISPYVLDMSALVLGGRTLMESLSWEPGRGSRLLVVSRESGEAVASFPVGSRYCLHLINSFEAGGRLVVDVLELDRPVYDQYEPLPDLFADVCEGRPARFVLDVEGGGPVERRVLDYRLAPDFPSIDPRRASRPCEEFWALGISATGRRGRKFFDQLLHADWREPRVRDIYRPPPRQYLGAEPVFVGDARDETRGAVICQVIDAERRASAFAIFDASRVAAGPLATVELDAPVPPGFHAVFVGAGAGRSVRNDGL